MVWLHLETEASFVGQEGGVCLSGTHCIHSCGCQQGSSRQCSMCSHRCCRRYSCQAENAYPTSCSLMQLPLQPWTKQAADCSDRLQPVAAVSWPALSRAAGSGPTQPAPAKARASGRSAHGPVSAALEALAAVVPHGPASSSSAAASGPGLSRPTGYATALRAPPAQASSAFSSKALFRQNHRTRYTCWVCMWDPTHLS